MADAVVARLRAILGLDDKQFQTQLRSVERRVSQASKRIAGVASTAAAAATTIGIGLVGRGIIRETLEAERVSIRLAQAITTTGRAARLSSAEVQAFASDMQRVTTFSDEAVSSLVASLLPFQNISEQVLPRASRAILDFAAFTGRNASEAARTLGRALDNPVKGMSMLGRAGISLSESTKATIKSLAEQGRIVEAQSLLLDELEARYKGAAVAARNTLGGSLEALKNVAGDLLEQDALLGVRAEVEKLISALEDPGVRQSIDQLGSNLTDALIKVAQAAAWAATNTEKLRVVLAALIGFRLAGIPGALGGAFIASATQADLLRDATAAAATATRELNEAQGAGIPIARANAEAQLSAAKAMLEKERAAELARQKDSFLSPAARSQVPELREADRERAQKLAALRASVLQLEAELAKAGETGDTAFTRTGSAADHAATSVSALSEAAAKAQEAIGQQLEDTKRQIALGALDERTRAQITAAIAQQEAALKGGTQATIDQQQAIFDLTGVLWDQEAAQKAATAATTAAERESERAAQAAERERERQAKENARLQFEPIRNAIEGIQDALADAIVDAFDDGFKSAKKFFNNLLTLGKRTIAELLSKQFMSSVVGSGTGQKGGGMIGGLVGRALGIGGESQSGQSDEQSFLDRIGRRLGGIFDPGDDDPNTNPTTTSSQIGQAIGGLKGIAKILTGIAGGIAIASSMRPNNVNSPLAGSRSGIYTMLGGSVGALFGAVLGQWLAGSGATGGAIGGALGGFLGNTLGKFQQNASTSRRWGQGIAALSGDPITILVTSLIGAEKAAVSVATRVADLATQFQHGIRGESPFGFVGLSREGSEHIPIKQTEAITEFFVSFDKRVSELLTERQRQIVRETLADSEFSRRGIVIDNEIVKVLKARFAASFEGLFDSEAVADFLGTLPDKLKSIDEVVSGLLGFLEERAAIIQELDDVLGENQLSDAAKSIRDVNRHFDDLIERMKLLGFTTAEMARAEEGRAAAIAKLKEGFATSIEDQILAMLDPGALAMREQERIQAERLRNAVDYEADLTRVAYLGQLERERIAREANKPITDLLTDLKTTLASQLSPTDVLAAAESRFGTLVAQAQGGDRSQLDEIAEAARNLLTVSLQVFASTEQFFQRREFVLRQLENLLPAGSTQALPGFATGGGFTVPGAGRDNVVPLFRVSGGERVAISTRAQQAEAAQNFTSLAAAIEDGNAQREAGNRAQLIELRGFSDRLDRQQAQLARVAALASRRARR